MTAAGVGGVLWEIDRREDRDHARNFDRALATIDFPVLLPATLPPELTEEFALPFGDGRVEAAYTAPRESRIRVVQRRATGAADALASGCGTAQPATPSGARAARGYDPPSCAPLSTPGGRLLSVDGDDAAAVVAGTAVEIRVQGTASRDLLSAYVDALRARPASALRTR